MTLSLGAGVIIARALGPEKRGYYGLIVMGSTLLFALGHMGIGSAIAYFTGKRTYDRKKILTYLVFSSFALGTLLSVVFYFTYGYIGDIWSGIPRSMMLIGLISVPFYFLYNFLDRFLLAALRIRSSNIARVLNSFFYLVMAVLFILILKGDVRETAVVYSASFVISSILAFVLFTKEFRPMGRLDLSMTGPFLNYGIRSYLIVVFNMLNYKIGVIMVKHYLTVSDVSYFQIASGIAQHLWYFPNSISILLFPTLMAMDKGSAEFSAKICRNNLFIMVVLAVIGLFITRPVVNLLYGMEYEPVSSVFYTLLWGIVIFPFYKFLAAYFFSERKLEVCIFASVVGIVVNVVANIILIPRFGVIGAGVATSISYSALSVILLLFFHSSTGIRHMDVLVPNREDFRLYARTLNTAFQKLKRVSGKGSSTDPE